MLQIECKDLSIGYDKAIVEGINFKVNEGDYICIVGENGAGKSTLVKTLLGLQDKLGGEKILNSVKIGYLPQQTEVQKNFPASVREIVMSGYQGKKGMKPFYTKQMKDEAQNFMIKLKIEDLAKRSYSELSGGQQQRVLLCRALCAMEGLLLLDEPTAGLDPKVTSDLYSLIGELNKEGVTILMVSHDVQSVLDYSNKILHIGKRYFFGTKKEYLDSDIGKYFVGGELIG